MTLSISCTGVLESLTLEFLGIFKTLFQDTHTFFLFVCCRNTANVQQIQSTRQSSTFIQSLSSHHIYCLLHLMYINPPYLAHVCVSKWHLWYQRQTTLDQKPHKSAAFSPDRMCSGYLLKVAVKPYPLILMFHFSICIPWDDCVCRFFPSVLIPSTVKQVSISVQWTIYKRYFI